MHQTEQLRECGWAHGLLLPVPYAWGQEEGMAAHGRDPIADSQCSTETENCATVSSISGRARYCDKQQFGSVAQILW